MSDEEIARWLGEDRAEADLTSRSVIPEGTEARASVRARQTLTVAGLEPAVEVLEACDAEVDLLVEDGDAVDDGQALLEADGPAYGLLSAERTALNLIAHLSGIATRTAEIVERAVEANPSCDVLATRKTTPGLRELEHEAVRAGGGQPHRSHLADAVLVKENHLAFLTVEEAVEAARSNAPDAFLMVEAEDVDQARAVARAGADGVLLDNFEPELVADIADLLKRISPELTIEASGGITTETVADYAEHVDRVSLGSITHSAPAADVSMQVEPA